jgi:hypothetical protein
LQEPLLSWLTMFTIVVVVSRNNDRAGRERSERF